MKAVINFATGYYIKGQQRLQRTLTQFGYDGDFLPFNDVAQIGAPKHQDNPYAFKIYCFEKALEQGYTKILWLDASIYAIAPIDPVWDMVDKIGYCKQYAGHLAGTWTNDRTLEYFGVTRDEAMKMEMYGNGGFLALDFDNELAAEFYAKWKAAMEAGMFIGQWNNTTQSESQDARCQGHRHDMSCGSIIANQLEMFAYPKDLLMAYVGHGYEEPPDTCVLHCHGNFNEI